MNEAGVTMDNPQDKLDWLAFRYVANELNALERDSFEGQLATNQSAREAVARMVQRTTDLSRAQAEELNVPVVAASQDAWTSNSASWLTVGLGSCLVLFLAVFASRPEPLSAPDAPLHEQAARPAIESLDLAYAWAEARAPQDEFAEIMSELPVFNDVSHAVADQTPPADESLGPPSWMIAAVARMDKDLG